MLRFARRRSRLLLHPPISEEANMTFGGNTTENLKKRKALFYRIIISCNFALPFQSINCNDSNNSNRFCDSITIRQNLKLFL